MKRENLRKGRFTQAVCSVHPSREVMAAKG